MTVAGIGKGLSIMYGKKGEIVLVKYDDRGFEVKELEGQDLTFAIIKKYADMSELIEGAEKYLTEQEKDISKTRKALASHLECKKLLEEALVIAQKKGKIETISEKDLYDRVL